MDQFKQHVISQSELMSLMLQSFKAGKYIEAINFGDIIDKISDECFENKEISEEDILACQLIEQLIEMNTKPINN